MLVLPFHRVATCAAVFITLALSPVLGAITSRDELSVRDTDAQCAVDAA